MKTLNELKNVADQGQTNNRSASEFLLIEGEVGSKTEKKISQTTDEND